MLLSWCMEIVQISEKDKTKRLHVKYPFCKGMAKILLFIGKSEPKHIFLQTILILCLGNSNNPLLSFALLSFLHLAQRHKTHGCFVLVCFVFAVAVSF